jgi:energy-coupling factor transport system ATP-binding protein
VAEYAIQVNNLSYTYEEGEKILHDVSFSLPHGSLTAIIGLSGCGKSTLCQCLCGIIPQVLGGEMSGEVLLEGEDIRHIPLAHLAKKIGLVMQTPDLQLVTTTVEDELAFAPENLCLPPDQIGQIVDQVLEWLHFSHLRLVNPHELSGGQKRLLAIGSVLTLDPRIVILDEPLSHLDRQGKQLVKQAIVSLLQQGRTVVMVEHDWQSADFADLWLVMAEGRVLRCGKPVEIINDKDFLCRQNLI